MMMKMAFAAMVVSAGMTMALQPATNAGLSSRIGMSGAILINCVVALFGGIVLYIARGTSRPLFPGDIPWQHYLGGVFGFYIIVTLAFAFPRIGGALAVALVVLGQGIMALVIDHFGLMGMPKDPVTLTRVVGLLLIGGGIVLLRW